MLKHQPGFYVVLSSVADPDHFDADPDRDPDTCFHFEHPQLLKFDSDVFTDPDPVFDFNADPDPAFQNDADLRGTGSATIFFKH